MPTTQSQWIVISSNAFAVSIVFKLTWFVVTPVLAAIASLDANALGDHEFEIDENTFTERNKFGVHVTNWKNVISIEVLKDYVVVKVGRFTYHIIPAAAFESRHDFEKVCIELCNWKSNA